MAACGESTPDVTPAEPAPTATAVIEEGATVDDEVTDMAAFFPNGEDISGWNARGDLETYQQDTLFDLVNGQADAFFAYNFRQVAVQSYESDEGVNLRIEIWELASPADAYGLFTRNVAGTPANFGNDGDLDPGRRVAFWQDRYYVQVRAREPVPEETISAFGEAVAAALPSGGEHPGLVAEVPTQHLIPRSTIFFRREISIQDEIWLGGENILGLDDESRGALAQYDVDGARAYLVAVQYPTSDQAAAAVSRLQEADLDDLVTVGTSGELFGAVFGNVPADVADDLLRQLWAE